MHSNPPSAIQHQAHSVPQATTTTGPATFDGSNVTMYTDDSFQSSISGVGAAGEIGSVSNQNMNGSTPALHLPPNSMSQPTHNPLPTYNGNAPGSLSIHITPATIPSNPSIAGGANVAALAGGISFTVGPGATSPLNHPPPPNSAVSISSSGAAAGNRTPNLGNARPHMHPGQSTYGLGPGMGMGMQQQQLAYLPNGAFGGAAGGVGPGGVNMGLNMGMGMGLISPMTNGLGVHAPYAQGQGNSPRMGMGMMPGGGNGAVYGGPGAPPFAYTMGGGGVRPPIGAAGMGMVGSPPMGMGMGKMHSPRIGMLPNGAMDPAQMTGNYGPAAAAAAAAAAGNTTGRTVYVGTLPPEASVDELMNLVRFGPVESVRVIPEKSCVFISFLDGATAAAFHADATVKKLTLRGIELKIDWGKPSVVPASVVHAIAANQATRNVYLGNLDESHTESNLRDDLARFGPIDQIKIVRDKGIGFVHFLSILAAMRVVATLSTEPAWKEKRIGYGKDRCAYVPRAQQAAVQAAQAQAAAAIGRTIGMAGVPFQAFNPRSPAALYGPSLGSPVFAQNWNGSGFHYDGPRHAGPAYARDGHHQQQQQQIHPANRCVYMGNIPEGSTVEDVCNIVRGGLLQEVRYLPEKNIAFITFVRPEAAHKFHHLASTLGLALSGTRLKIGWGKPSAAIPAGLRRSIEEESATRNVYLGHIEDMEVFTKERLEKDFEVYGEIEHINFVPEKKIGFVNFCSVQQAVRALEGTRANPEYHDVKVSYGKDRCANPPGPKHFGTPASARAARPGAESNRGDLPAKPSSEVTDAARERMNSSAAAVDSTEDASSMGTTGGNATPSAEATESM